VSEGEGEFKIERAVLSIDGNQACASLGDNLQEGQAEFEPVLPRAGEFLYKAQIRAGAIALVKLYKKLGRRDFSFEWWPARPGPAKAN